MFDALSGADNRCVARVDCRVLIQPIVGFLNDPRHPGARARRDALAPVREDQLQTLEVQSRFLRVFQQRFAQFRGVRRFHEARQRAELLRFRVVEVPELVQIQVFQRSDTHTDVSSWKALRNHYARAVPRVRSSR